jgi:2-dehydro-3-deoxyphosphogluconate aldolase/(4S)-4-hydroxy-2-oxoglutarate aldolase
MDSTIDAIRRNRIIVIYRGIDPSECLEISRVLMDAGLRLFEVTMNSPDTAATIELLTAELGSEASIGAGTVTSATQVDLAKESGASYIISPNSDDAVIHRTRSAGLVSIPGALTPTEVLAARDAGAHMVKVFPINVMGPEYLRQLKGPIDDVQFVATGGVRLEMIAELFSAGAAAVALGVHLIGAELIRSKDWTGLRRHAERFVAATHVHG